MNEVIPILIPSYQPDERFIDLLKALKEANLGPVVIVDDGSGSEYQHIFKEAEALIVDLGGVLLHHDINRGKGRGLKTGFTFIMEKWPDAIGCITCDSDGQHSPEAILSVRNEMLTHQNALILGSRSFDGDNVPRKSRIGNKFIATMFRYVTGNRIVDTQTGLRGIPMDFMRTLPDVKGERFEYEMRMLVETAGKVPVIEIPIETIYDSVDNHQTHFNPFKDSMKIFFILLLAFLRFVFSSLTSCIIDLAFFQIFCWILAPHTIVYTLPATILARIISATYNFTVNYKIVFKSEGNVLKALARFAGLAVTWMFLSAGLVTGGNLLLPWIPDIIIKMIVDTSLFFVSFKLQQKFVFGKGGKKNDDL